MPSSSPGRPGCSRARERVSASDAARYGSGNAPLAAAGSGMTLSTL
ncbi:hypothetical protein [Paenibacillus sp. 22594]